MQIGGNTIEHSAVIAGFYLSISGCDAMVFPTIMNESDVKWLID